MRVIFSANWIFQGWITSQIFLTHFLQAGVVLSCQQNEYEHNGRCCRKCDPGKYVFSHCEGSLSTKCLDCAHDMYQPDWNSDTKCIPQKFCDEGKGFNRSRPHNPTAAEPCRCKHGFQCSLINCEYCEAIRKCPVGEGVVMSENGRASCVACPYGLFSNSTSVEPCKKWTDCKAFGKTEKQPGSTTTDSVCGLHSPGMTPWVVVAVLSVIIVISLAILCMFCCKDKLNFLSVNLRTCLRSLKGTGNQEESTSYPISSSSPQTLPLICQEGTFAESLITCPSTQITISDRLIAFVNPDQDQDGADTSSGSSSEDSGCGPSSPRSGSSCSCPFSMKEPIEVGENEDCSQLLPTGLATCCSCRPQDSTGQVQLIGLKEPALCESCSPEKNYLALHLDYTSPIDKDVLAELRESVNEAEELYRQSEPCCCSIDSTTIPPLPSLSTNEQGLSLIQSGENKLTVSDGLPDVDDQNQCSESSLTSGQVTGNNNTTFISSGQVMNFSGEVIVVYVRQTSVGSSRGGDEPFSCPVQEEFPEDSFESQTKSNTSTTLRAKRSGQPEKQLPVQEMTNDWSFQK